MESNSNQLLTFGDTRRLILETIRALKDGTMDSSRGMAIAANMKVLNDSVQVEINAAKLVLATEGKAHNFGPMIALGRRMIGSDESGAGAK